MLNQEVREVHKVFWKCRYVIHGTSSWHSSGLTSGKMERLVACEIWICFRKSLIPKSVYRFKSVAVWRKMTGRLFVFPLGAGILALGTEEGMWSLGFFNFHLNFWNFIVVLACRIPVWTWGIHSWRSDWTGIVFLHWDRSSLLRGSYLFGCGGRIAKLSFSFSGS